MVAPALGTPWHIYPCYRHVETGSSTSGRRARKSAIFPSAVVVVVVAVAVALLVVVVARDRSRRSGDRVRRRAADKYVERVDEGCLKMQLRSASSRTESQAPRLRRAAHRCRSRDGTSLPLSGLRIGPAGPETAEGCSQKWSGCPTNTRRSTAT